MVTSDFRTSKISPEKKLQASNMEKYGNILRNIYLSERAE
jgi:hypothetical protein